MLSLATSIILLAPSAVAAWGAVDGGILGLQWCVLSCCFFS